MKIYIFAIVLISGFLFLGCSALKTSESLGNEGFDLYILAGQSNMAGRGVITDSLKAISNDQVWMLNKDLNWTLARHPIHFDKPSIAGVGPGLSFGIAMANANPGKKIGLIPCAVGGTSIDTWQPGVFDKATSTHPYDDAVERITQAMKHGKVKGMIWLQGESDSNEALAPVYLDKLETLVGQIRKLTGEKNLPIVVGELGSFKTNYQLINRELHKAPSRIKNLAVAASEGYTDKGDHTHFDAKSADSYGERFARQMQNLQK